MSVLIDKLAARLERALGREMERVRAQVQQRIGVPVERIGNRVIRSRPGEPPRMDSRRLITSASAQTLNATRTVVGSVSLDTPYIRRLVRGMNRPAFGPVLKDNKPAILDALRAAAADRS